MRKIVLFIGMSRDGCIEARSATLLARSEELRLPHEHVPRGDGHVHRAWERLQLDGGLLLAHRRREARRHPVEVEFARLWRDMPKMVYSRTLESAGWGTEIRREVDPAEIRALEQPGGDIVIGGPNLADLLPAGPHRRVPGVRSPPGFRAAWNCSC